jgi:hypothetical protein
MNTSEAQERLVLQYRLDQGIAVARAAGGSVRPSV